MRPRECSNAFRQSKTHLVLLKACRGSVSVVANVSAALWWLASSPASHKPHSPAAGDGLPPQDVSLIAPCRSAKSLAPHPFPICEMGSRGFRCCQATCGADNLCSTRHRRPRRKLSPTQSARPQKTQRSRRESPFGKKSPARRS